MTLLNRFNDLVARLREASGVEAQTHLVREFVSDEHFREQDEFFAYLRARDAVSDEELVARMNSAEAALPNRQDTPSAA